MSVVQLVGGAGMSSGCPTHAKSGHLSGFDQMSSQAHCQKNPRSVSSCQDGHLSSTSPDHSLDCGLNSIKCS